MLNLERKVSPEQNVGQPRDRVDGPLKVTGGARYSAEIPTDGVLYGVLVTSTVPKATINVMDTSDALKEPGVVAVYTPFNAPKLPKPPEGSPQPQTLSLLQNATVYYNNQPIGLVVAETLEAAQHAATLVKIDYAQERPLLDFEKEKRNAYKPNRAGRDETDSLRGDPDAAFASASYTVKNVYTTPMENHNPMEPHATIASWDAGGTKLTVYDSTQGVFGVQGTLAHIFQIDPSNVRCVAYFIGGGFGCKGTAWSHVPLAAMAALDLKRPVKLVLERSNMFGMVGYRPQTEQTISLASDASGKLVSTRHDVVTQTSTFGEFIESSAIATRLLYSCPNMATSHRLTRLNRGTPTYMRAPGESSGTFAIETAMDEMAVKLGMDPLAFRLANYAEIDENEKKPFSSKSLRQCYAQGAQRFGWDQRSSTPRSRTTSDGLLIGCGMATATYPANRSAATATVRYMQDGSAYVLAGTQDIGTGTYTILGQIAADAMGVDENKVRVEIGDTDYPQNPGSGGSQSAASSGSAVHDAGLAAKQAAIAAAVTDTASPVYGQPGANVDIENGLIFNKSESTSGELVSTMLARQKLPYIEATVKSQSSPDAQNYTKQGFGAVFSEVHVDPDLGIVRVNRVTGVYGIGRLLNAKTGRSQLIGGIIFGIGMALMEQTLLDPRDGRPVNADLADYQVPVNRDIPRIDVSVVDEVDPYVNPLGIKGIGEIGITGIVASLGNAVYNATGVRVRSLPITLDKLMV